MGQPEEMLILDEKPTNCKHTRYCPNCNNSIVYASKQGMMSAAKKNSVCRKCAVFLNINNVFKKGKLNINYGKPLTEEVRNKISKSKKGTNLGNNNPFYGKHHTQETKAKLANHFRGVSLTQETKDKISESVKGVNNPRYGKSLMSIWIEKYGEEKAKELDAEWKRKQSISSSGSNNPMYGKPVPQGSGNGWSGWYKGWYFRSFLELSYMINVIEKQGLKWESAEREDLKIPYVDYFGINRTYKADFLIDDKELIEIKPKKMHETVLVGIKALAAEKFCFSRGLRYLLLDVEQEITKKEVLRLRAKGLIKFIPRYEKKLLEGKLK